MARTEKQLQAAYENGKISLKEFHEALSKIGSARHARILQRKESGQYVIYQVVLKKGEKWKLNI